MPIWDRQVTRLPAGTTRLEPGASKLLVTGNLNADNIVIATSGGKFEVRGTVDSSLLLFSGCTVRLNLVVGIPHIHLREGCIGFLANFAPSTSHVLIEPGSASRNRSTKLYINGNHFVVPPVRRGAPNLPVMPGKFPKRAGRGDAQQIEAAYQVEIASYTDYLESHGFALNCPWCQEILGLHRRLWLLAAGHGALRPENQPHTMKSTERSALHSGMSGRQASYCRRRELGQRSSRLYPESYQRLGRSNRKTDQPNHTTYRVLLRH